MVLCIISTSPADGSPRIACEWPRLCLLCTRTERGAGQRAAASTPHRTRLRTRHCLAGRECECTRASGASCRFFLSMGTFLLVKMTNMSLVLALAND